MASASDKKAERERVYCKKGVQQRRGMAEKAQAQDLGKRQMGFSPKVFTI